MNNFVKLCTVINVIHSDNKSLSFELKTFIWHSQITLPWRFKISSGWLQTESLEDRKYSFDCFWGPLSKVFLFHLNIWQCWRLVPGEHSHTNVSGHFSPSTAPLASQNVSYIKLSCCISIQVNKAARKISFQMVEALFDISKLIPKLVPAKLNHKGQNNI